ncbi:lactate dehydrogenase [Fructilactobacillus vespulae]|uniref:lactate dehydrogenase n=1 Tax=Fructilactobacillus vespulae TaxID=1249630 RepID=UPI0039B5179B
MFVDDYDYLTVVKKASEICQNLVIEKIDDNTDLATMNGLIYLPNTNFYDPKMSDAVEIAQVMREPLFEFRKTLNELIANGFNGKIILNSPHDEVFVYFAAYFSGLDVKKIIGIGTLAQEIILRESLVKKFRVNGNDINVNTLGLNTKNLVAWSRVYIGPSPLLTYVANGNDDNDKEIISDLTTQLNDALIVTNPIIQAKAISYLLNCLFKNQSLICSVTSVKKENDQFSLLLGPKLVNEIGIYHAINLQLSDDENEELDNNLKQATTIIENIKKGKKDAKKD